MSQVDQLRCLTELTRSVNFTERLDRGARHEIRVKSVFGNLGIERPTLALDEVRQVLHADRPE
jgi:hypothetical protein